MKNLCFFARRDDFERCSNCCLKGAQNSPARGSGRLLSFVAQAFLPVFFFLESNAMEE